MYEAKGPETNIERPICSSGQCWGRPVSQGLQNEHQVFECLKVLVMLSPKNKNIITYYCAQESMAFSEVTKASVLASLTSCLSANDRSAESSSCSIALTVFVELLLQHCVIR